jgi:hypothetical protein
MSQNWRTRVTAQDHFGQQKRISEIEQRRPAPRNGRDLGLGPGIGSSAVVVTNWNDLLAQFDVYYSSAPAHFGAPIDTVGFVGITYHDSTYGGTQQVTGLVSGNHYRRVFRRNPSDARSVSFAAWEWTNKPAAAPPTVESFNESDGSGKIVANGSWVATNWNLEREGRHAMIRATFTWGGATIALTAVDHTNQQMGTIQDLNWRPIWHHGTLTYNQFRAVSLNSDTGGVNLTAGLKAGGAPSTQTEVGIANGDVFSFGMAYLLPKNVV